MNAVQSDEGFREFEPKVMAQERPRYGEIAAALAKAQAEMSNPGFDQTNPHFKNKFASLAAVRNAVIPVMAKHGICVNQDLISHEDTVSCTTILTHGSGQQMTFGPLTLPVSKNDAQGFGSAATYCRRYSLMAVACVVGDADDDANAATGKATNGEIHSPKGDMGKEIPIDQVRATATAMRGILELDVEEHVKQLRVLDKHDVLNRDPDLYVAASGELSTKERSSWKTYVSLAKAAQKADQNVANAGKRW